jgi:hypothetical protein
VRNPAQHLDDNTVVDVLERAVRLEDVAAVAVHLATCCPCREMVQICRDLRDRRTPGHMGPQK